VPAAPIIDLRSDTVTKPTAAVREAMAGAPVGDDCYHDDPSVLALEAKVAERLGKPAAVFLPSGTMANQLSIHTHVRPGAAIAAPPQAHVQIHEDASAARLSGAQVMPIGDRTGYAPADLAALFAEESCGWPPVGLVWLENTLGAAGGKTWPQSEVRAIGDLARAQSTPRPVHLDGARLWNAHIATGTSLAELAAPADTVSICLSKGLGAPAGSLLCGSRSFIERAWATRHALGGSMRQAGILAAAGLHVIEHHVDRLADDHRRARQLAEALADLPCWEARPVETNIVLFEVVSPELNAEALCAPLRDAGVLVYPNVSREVRMVVHLGVDDTALERAVEIIRRTLCDLPG